MLLLDAKRWVFHNILGLQVARRRDKERIRELSYRLGDIPP